MSADLEFEKEVVDAGAKKYKVKRIKGQSTEMVKPGDTITFTRSGSDDSEGFSLAFVGDKSPADVSAQKGKTSHTETAPPTKKVLAWKYTVSFPNDEAKGEKVEKYDPIIVINPGLSSSRVSPKDIAVFVAGALVAWLGMTFLPGAMG